ncbi:MAG TPA: carotenoid 1,2-hydratase [Polyangia bacterium]|nr:carotenoid 1,2-hydratase [Polyangia bacterium]
MSRIHDVRPGGYAWWYFDALSDDGSRALSVIFFVGSVFSPEYAARLRRGQAARAEEHVAVNVALYDRKKRLAWVMSEYGPSAFAAGDDEGPRIATSGVEHLPNGTLRLTLRERTAPFMAALAGVGARIEGTIELEPHAPPLEPIELATGGERHWWQARMPRARARVRFSRPDWSFDGVGYHDVNAGDGRLERAFASWSWARFHDAARTTILYALHERDRPARALVVDARDDRPAIARPALLLPEGERRRPPWGLPLPRWFALERDGATLRCSAGRLYEAAPFYARYAATLAVRGGDEPRDVTGVGEYLDLDRFASPSIQFLLRFKTRRST